MRPSLHGVRAAWLIRWMNTSSRVGSTSVQRQGSWRTGRDRRFERLAVGAADVERRAERRHHLDARLAGQLARQPVGAGPFRLESDQARSRDQLVGRAARDQLAVEDVGDVVAALGLVHVMGRDQHRDAALGERVDFVPEVAARLRVDARGRLVEQQQLGLVRASRRPARAAASSRPRAAPQAASRRSCKPELVERCVDACSARRSRL